MAAHFYWDQGLTSCDFFCGAGGLGCGIEQAGVQLTLAVNHDERSIATYRRNFPNAEVRCAWMEEINWTQARDTFIGAGAPECFPAGTLILTEHGLMPIEEITVGTRVLTHRNRWMPVSATMRQVSDTIVLKGHGHYGLEVTPHHPFFARCRSKPRSSIQKTYYDPEWIKASELAEAFWSTPTAGEALPIPPVGSRGVHFSTEFWWMIGRWLGDGIVQIRPHGRHAEIAICCGNHEGDELERKLDFAPPTEKLAGQGEFRWRRRQMRTATLFETQHKGLAMWLLEQFGKLAHGKKLPAWALTMPVAWRQALLEGYISADGFTDPDRGKVRCSTVSRQLAFGIRLLAESLGHRVAIHRYEPGGKQLEGRQIKERQIYILTWLLHRKHEYGTEDEEHSWLPVKGIHPGRQGVGVFNLSVAEDESYVADGIVVHNCRNHSPSAGEKLNDQMQLCLPGWTDYDTRPEVEKSRASMWQVFRAAEAKAEKKMPYHSMIFENVPEVHKWREYEAWVKAMLELGYEHQMLYLNAMHFNVAQCRDRWIAVFWREGAKKPELDLRPPAPCMRCGQDVAAVQCWKNAKKQGKYDYRMAAQYTYNCPVCASRVEPYFRCAASVLDFSDKGIKIGDRRQRKLPPLKADTMQRIQDGIDRFFKHPQIPSPSVRDVPVIDGMAPFWITYYSNGKAYSIYEPFCTFSTHERCGLVFPPADGSLDINQCTFRMINETEIKGGSGLPAGYEIVADGKDEVVRQCGHMVPPPMATWVTQRVINAI